MIAHFAVFTVKAPLFFSHIVRFRNNRRSPGPLGYRTDIRTFVVTLHFRNPLSHPLDQSLISLSGGVIRCYVDRTPQGRDTPSMHLERGDRTREGDDLRTQQQHGSPAVSFPLCERQLLTPPLFDQPVIQKL